jgi:hypothetical protein
MADIVVNDIDPRNQYVAGGGLPTVFPFTFPIFALTDIKVFNTPVGQPPNDVTQILIYNVDYTVTNNVPPAVGGTITLMVGAPAGNIITVIRDMPDNRLNNYIDGGLFQATDVNTDFDRCVMMNQQNKLYLAAPGSIGVGYNQSAVITPIVDNILPLLPANCVWMKNNANTAIVAVAFAGGGGGGAILPTVPNTIAIFNNAAGVVQSSIFLIPVADGAPGQSMITNGAGQLSFATIAGGVVAWNVVAVSGPMVANNGYIANGGGLVTLTLPAVVAVGSAFRICAANANLWSIAQNAGQSIQFDALATTVGVGGSLTATSIGDAIEIVCIVANTTFLVLSSVGNITLV